MICAYIFVCFVYDCLIQRDLQNIVERIKFCPMFLFGLKINYPYDIPVCIPRVHGRNSMVTQKEGRLQYPIAPPL